MSKGNLTQPDDRFKITVYVVTPGILGYSVSHFIGENMEILERNAKIFADTIQKEYPEKQITFAGYKAKWELCELPDSLLDY